MMLKAMEMGRARLADHNTLPEDRKTIREGIERLAEAGRFDAEDDRRWHQALEDALLSGGSLAALDAYEAERPKGLNIRRPDGTVSGEAMSRVGLLESANDLMESAVESIARTDLDEEFQKERLEKARQRTLQRGLDALKSARNFAGMASDDPGQFAAFSRRLANAATIVSKRNLPQMLGPGITGLGGVIGPGPKTAVQRVEELADAMDFALFRNVGQYVDITFKDKEPARGEELDGLILFLKHMAAPTLGALASGTTVEPFEQTIRGPDGEPLTIKYDPHPEVVSMFQLLSSSQKKYIHQLALDSKFLGRLLETNPSRQAGEVSEVVGEQLTGILAEIEAVEATHEGVLPAGAVSQITRAKLAEYNTLDSKDQEAIDAYFAGVAGTRAELKEQRERAKPQPMQQPPLFSEGGQP
jgi:hypothetical protein